MMTEYAAIVASCLALFVWRHRPLEAPFPWYASQPLDQEPDMRLFTITSALQFLAEIGVDVVCVSFERRSVDPKKVWRSVNKGSFAITFMITTWYAYVCVVAFFTHVDSFAACEGKDMCMCVGKGFTVGGVLETYCTTIIGVNQTEAQP